ncbi:uncharacterized protein [Magallana gigas]|uniref:uncharacterized protein n=1 Tax=Magallana gigas TaxID=29159 RepID=UPI003341C2D3
MNADMNVTGECSFCGQWSTHLLRCSQCKEVYYCSRDCQRGHWREGHRERCKEETTYSEFTSTDAVCGFCSMKTNQLKRCSGCKDVSYCSKECHKQDWSRGHKNNCEMIANKERPSFQVVSTEDNSSKDETTPVITDLERCSKCKIGGELKLCQRCKKQKYCSVECQKADWKSHKVSCLKKGQGNSMRENERRAGDLLPICAYCRNKKTSLTCSGCKSVYYCSEPCQKLDLVWHKTFCRSNKIPPKIRETLNSAQCSILGLVTPEEHQGNNPNDGNQHATAEQMRLFQRAYCRQCHKKSIEIPCPYCKTVMYCSIDCRDIHKTVHQKSCTFLQGQSQQENTSGKPENSSSFSTFETFVEYSPFHAIMPHGRSPCYIEDGADLGLIIERSEQSRLAAMMKTSHKFPNHTLIIRIREIPVEEKSLFASNICTQPLVFLSYIRRFHKYRGRHNVYLQDSERREIYASFYLPNDDPSPHFRWSDVVPGKFIAILLPCIHFFNDETVGLRVDKASYVYCFDVKD